MMRLSLKCRSEKASQATAVTETSSEVGEKAELLEVDDAGRVDAQPLSPGGETRNHVSDQCLEM